MAEAEKVASRKVTMHNPTDKDEAVDVLRRRVFEAIASAAEQAVADYTKFGTKNATSLPGDLLTPELNVQFC